MFEPLPDGFTYPSLEREIQEYWDHHDVFARVMADRATSPVFSFFEGPPTVNGRPGIHHLMARSIKDIMCRYKTMRGYRVRRQAGWDTHGLPVELAVEKELGITEKSQIETYGVDKFNAACKDFVYRNINATEGWGTFTRRMGYWLDMDSAYITCTNDYVESVWWALKQFFDRGLIYKGFRVVPQSPTLGTPLSSHELSQNYKDVRDPNVYLKVRIASSPVDGLTDASILVWTTTPWTLFGNVALAVGPDITYVLVRNTRTVGEQTVEERLVLAESRLAALDGETEVLASFTGAQLAGTSYHRIFDDVAIDVDAYPGIFTVHTASFVTTEDGSGVVHIAPAFGQDDFELSKVAGLPLVQPVTPDGHFTSDIKEFGGRAVKTFTYADHTEEGADRDIVKVLKQRGQVYRAAFDYLHSYPHCWRTDNPVIYYARDSWFIKSPQYKDRLIELNKTIDWLPPEIGAGRFGNWLEDVKDWALSRDRYWGTPLPIWVSEDGSDLFAVGSVAELMNGLYEGDGGARVPVAECGVDVDLHRPFVDKVVFERDGKTYRRVREVIDVWFDSGAMPFAQFHYPFENEEQFRESFPADFIAEGIDQTRGWFYTLHNIATALFDQPAYKHVVVNDLILDKSGQKMSKSKGNTVDPFVIMDKYGADAVRWYLTASSPAWKTKLFNEEDISKTVIADFFRSLTNTYEFFALYAGIDGYDGSQPAPAVAERPEIDRWILARLLTVQRGYIEAMDSYETTKAARLVQDFMIDDVSNWYVRRNRRRFWKGEFDADKCAAYDTLREVLEVVVQMMAPIAPFITEVLYRRLKNSATPLTQFSIHCSILQMSDASYADDELEHRMGQAQHIVFLARSLREKAKIKTRQPLRRILLPVSSPAMRREIQAMEDLITEEINVKGIEYVTDDTNIVRRSTKPNFKVIGKKYGDRTKDVAAAIKALTHDQVRHLEQSSVVVVSVGDQTMQIDFEDVEIVSEDIEGWLVASDGGLTVALDTEIDEALEREGLAREFVSRIQKIRKDSGYEVTDRITIAVAGDEQALAAFQSMRSYIETETLADRFDVSGGPQELGLEINGREVSVRIERV